MSKALTLAVPCPQCMAAAAAPCVTVSGYPMPNLHIWRLKASVADPALNALADHSAVVDPWTAATRLFGGTR